MKLSLIIAIILKLVNCAITYSESANLNNVGKNSFNFTESNVITTSEFHKTQYEDKRNYFCSVCLNNALCKEKEKCYMCIKYCKNFKNVQEHPKFEITTEVNFYPDEKTLNTNSTAGTEFTIIDSKIKSDILTKLFNYIVQSTLIKMSTIPKKTSIRAGFKQENLQTMDNSIHAAERVINNNLIVLNKNNENNIDIRSLPYNTRKKRNSNATEYQPNVNSDLNLLLQKRHLQEIDINNTQIPEENFNSARPYGGPFRKLNFPVSNINKPPLLSNNKREETNDELLKHIEDQPTNRNQRIASPGESIFPVNESVKQIPLITSRNQVPKIDANQNGRVLNTPVNGIASQPFTENDANDAILSSPLQFNNGEGQTCNENLNGDTSAVDENTFSLLQNLEKKIENIADLIKQGCNHNDELQSGNPENSNGLRLNKNKIKFPGLPNDIFSQPRNKMNKERANIFPNRMMQIPDSQSKNEDGDDSGNQNPVKDDKILRDINPELFSENDDPNSDLNNDDELANNENEPNTNKNNNLELPAPISFRNQFRLRKNPLHNDQNKPLITELFKKRVDSKPNLNNRFSDQIDEQIPEENGNSFEPENNFEEKPEEAFEPGVPWSNNGERSKSNSIPKSKPHIPKIKLMPRNNIKDRLKNNALPVQPRENFKPALSHLNNFISKLSDAPFQKIPKTNPPWNRIANPDIPKLHFPLKNLDAEKPGRIPMQRINSKPQSAIADEQPKTRFLLPKDRPGKLPNLPLIHQRFGEQDDLDPSAPVGSPITNYEQNPNTLLGRVVIPQQNGNDGVESLDDMENKKIFFEGTGVNLPLTIKKDPEGTYKVSLAVDNICNTCNGNSCNLKDGIVGAPPNQENIKSGLKYKDLNDNVQNLSLPKNELGVDSTPQGETNKKFTNARESNNANEETPEIKPRLFDKEHNFLNRRRNNEAVELKPKPSFLFPRLSQIAKRSPSLLFDTPLLKLGGNYLDSGNSDDFKTLSKFSGSNFKNKMQGLNAFDGKNGEKDTAHKKVALMKDMLTWMKNVAEENTA